MLRAIAVKFVAARLTQASDCALQEYYSKDWTEEEQALGKHLPTMRFAENSRSQRGMQRIKKEAALESSSSESAV